MGMSPYYGYILHHCHEERPRSYNPETKNFSNLISIYNEKS